MLISGNAGRFSLEKTDSTLCESQRLELQSYRESGWSMAREASSRASSGCWSLWRRYVAWASEALARNHTAMAQRVERDLKGGLIFQTEGSYPVLSAPIRITGSHLKRQLASDHVGPWPHTQCVRHTDKMCGAALALENLASRAWAAPLLSNCVLGQATYPLRASVWASKKRDC